MIIVFPFTGLPHGLDKLKTGIELEGANPAKYRVPVKVKIVRLGPDAVTFKTLLFKTFKGPLICVQVKARSKVPCPNCPKLFIPIP